MIKIDMQKMTNNVKKIVSFVDTFFGCSFVL